MKNLLPNSRIPLNLIWRWQNPASRLVPRFIEEHRRSHLALFLCPRFYGRLYGAPLGGRFSDSGRTNSVQSASLLVGPNGGSSQFFIRGLSHV